MIRRTTLFAVATAACAASLSIAGALAGCSSSDDGGGGSAADATPPPPDAPTASPDVAAPIDAGLDAPMESAPPDPCAADGGLPPTLQCTGLYSDWPSKTVAPENVEYTPSFVLWSDGATKRRWISLPAGTKIDTADMDDWSFPAGTSIWKEFSLSGKRVETRLLRKRANGGWTYALYRWSADESSATLLETGEKGVNGTTYEVPSLDQCGQCHSGRKDQVLGFDLVGLGAAGAQGITLADLVSQGKLTQAPPATTIAIPEDATQKAAPALGWLHMNCGVSCHNANSTAGATQTHLFMKLLASQLVVDGGTGPVSGTDTYTTAYKVTSNLAPGGMHYLRIAPGSSAQSLIPLMDLSRDSSTGFKPMPPLVSHVADTDDVKKIQDWIDALP